MFVFIARIVRIVVRRAGRVPLFFFNQFISERAASATEHERSRVERVISTVKPSWPSPRIMLFLTGARSATKIPRTGLIIPLSGGSRRERSCRRPAASTSRNSTHVAASRSAFNRVETWLSTDVVFFSLLLSHCMFSITNRPTSGHYQASVFVQPGRHIYKGDQTTVSEQHLTFGTHVL